MIEKIHYLGKFLSFKGKLKAKVSSVLLICFLFNLNFNSNLYANEADTSVLQNTIKGVVTDSDGNVLPGVNVIVAGTNRGTTTDFDGNYQISAATGDVLEFSYVGMLTKNIAVGDSTTIDVTLEEDRAQLDEVVVVGYQTKEKANLTGSVAVIKSEALENRPTTNLSNLLPGLAGGVTVALPNPGRIGGGTDPRSIRIGALATRNTPGVLVIVDGVQGNIDDVNPNDVDTISILRDAEAAIYGSRASEGVIVITTKRGKSGRPSVAASFNTTIAIPNIHPVKSTTIEYMNYLREGWEQTNTTPLWRFGQVFQYIEDNNLTSEQAISDGNFAHRVVGGFPDTPVMYLGGNSDWYDILYDNAITHNYDLSVSGSSDKLNYYASFRAVDQESMLRFGTNSNTEYNARVKMEYKHNDKLIVGFNIPLSTQTVKEPTDYVGAQNFANFRWSFDHPYTQEGRYMSWNAAPSLVGRFIDAGDANVINYRINPQIYATYSPIKNLDISGRFTKSIFAQKRRALFKSFRTYFWDESPGGLNIQPFQTNVDVRNWFDQTFIGNVTASYKAIIKDDHTVRALVGTSHEEFLNDWTRAWRNNLVFDGLSSLDIGDSEEQFNDDAQSEVALKSIFGNLSYSFKDRYTVEGTFRRDGSSRFADGFKYDSFFSVGGAWNVTNEPFIQNLNLTALNSLKLRASWGQLGNQGSIGLYSFASTINIGTGVLLGVPGSVAPAQVANLGSFPNLDATWEAADKTNFGLDATLFNNRLSVEANYFITETKNGFFRQDFPSILGAAPPQINGANFKATGWIASLGWTDNINGDLSYNIRVNVSDANTEVLELADAPVVGYGYNAFVEGKPLGSMYGFAFDGLIQDDADLANYLGEVAGVTSLLRPGDAKYKDLDGDGVLEFREYTEDENGNPTADSGDLINLGDTERHYEYNVNLGVNWKNFNFTALLVGVGKWTVFDQTPQSYTLPWVQPYEHYINNYWTPTNTDGYYPRPFVVNGSFNQAVNVHNYRVSDAYYSRKSNAYLLLKNIQLGYTLPQRITDKINIQKLQLYVNASDVGFLINNMPKSYSPESPYNANVTPYPTTVSFGLNLNL